METKKSCIATQSARKNSRVKYPTSYGVLRLCDAGPPKTPAKPGKWTKVIHPAAKLLKDACKMTVNKLFTRIFVLKDANPRQAGGKNVVLRRPRLIYPFKGGVPATPSSTATLLRLHPSHSLCLRHPPLINQLE